MTDRLPRFEIRPLSEEDGGGYLITFPDYPGCMADGETPDAAVAEGRDALASYVATLRELGRPIPPSAKEPGRSWTSRLRRPSRRRWQDAPTPRASAFARWWPGCSPKGSSVARAPDPVTRRVRA